MSRNDGRKWIFNAIAIYFRTFDNDIFHVLLWSYDCGMIFLCTYQAFLVRKVPENYNEARYITFTMTTMSMNLVVYIITTSGMEGKNLVLVYCILQSVNASVALGCMFLPKIYVILFQPESNAPHNPVDSRLGTFVDDNLAAVVKSDSSVGESLESLAGKIETACSPARGREHGKVAAKIQEQGPGDKFEGSDDFNELSARGREQRGVTVDRTVTREVKVSQRIF